MRRPFPIDHFVARVVRPDLVADYTNLLYLCPNCNSLKGASGITDPCAVALASCLRVDESGVVIALNKEGERLVLLLALNSETMRDFRRRLLRVLRSLAEHDWEAYADWMKLPDDLPDLSKDPPPANSRPEGVDASWLARRRRGECPEVY
jgi:hypothetical protein